MPDESTFSLCLQLMLEKCLNGYNCLHSLHGEWITLGFTKVHVLSRGPSSPATSNFLQHVFKKGNGCQNNLNLNADHNTFCGWKAQL